MRSSAPEPGRPHQQPEPDARHGRLPYSPRPPVAADPGTGLVALDGGLAHVPPPGDSPPRLVLVLHGAGGSARQALDLLLPVADAHGLLLVAPQAHRSTWDVVVDGYGPDVERIGAVLQAVTDAHAVAGAAVAGFSDGASYALSLGVGNGDVFDSVVAFSPGFAAPLVRVGRARFFVSHGRADAVLPIDRCSRVLVPRLRTEGYDVTYEEFDGGHAVPRDIAERAARWLEAPAEVGA